jgi:hypothetical protein
MSTTSTTTTTTTTAQASVVNLTLAAPPAAAAGTDDNNAAPQSNDTATSKDAAAANDDDDASTNNDKAAKADTTKTEVAHAVPATDAVDSHEHAAAQQAALSGVLVVSEEVPTGTPVVRGYDFNQGVDYEALFKSYLATGIQATNLARAIDEVRTMLRWRGERVDAATGVVTVERGVNFLGFTSNMVSCGIREHLRYIAQHRLVDVMVTTCGAIEEDLMKCMNDTYIGSFDLDGATLRMKGQNRIGNMLICNNNYRALEDWIMPILDAMLREQQVGSITFAHALTLFVLLPSFVSFRD